MEITTQEYHDLGLRSVMHDLAMAGAKPNWIIEYKEQEEKRVLEPFRRGDPKRITKDDVVNLLEFEEKVSRERTYDLARGIINGKVAGTGEDMDTGAIKFYRDSLPTYFKLWEGKRDLLRAAQEDSNPELVSDALLGKAEVCFLRANDRRLGSVIRSYKDSQNRPDKGNWMNDVWIEALGERSQLVMGWNFIAAAELYTDIMKVDRGVDFPLEVNKDVYLK